MSFSTEWDTIYRKGEQVVVWPFNDLIRFIYRYTQVPNREHVKVLELGCGAGANIPLFLSLSADYYGIDGSNYIVDKVKAKYESYANHIISADFSIGIPFDEHFEIIFDRAAVTHNSTEDIKKILSSVYERLVEGGIYIGIDWFSVKHSDYSIGDYVDNNTRIVHDGDGQFNNYGRVHFSDESHIHELFKRFKMKTMEEKVVTTMRPCYHTFASWNFVACK